MEEKMQDISSAEDIDFIELLKKVLKHWQLILKICGVFALISLIIAFSLPKEYTTEVQLAPEVTDASAKSGLGGLAAIAGINMNSSAGTLDAFSPDLYPDIVKSTPFLLEILSIQVKSLDENIECTLFEYLEDYQKSAWFNNVLKAPFSLLDWVVNLFSVQEEGDSLQLQNPQLYILDKKQQEILKTVQERINLIIDKKTSIITVSVEMQDPLISAQLANIVLEKLQNYIITYRTQKAKQDKDFTEKVYEEAKQRYFEAQRNFAVFKDANKHISTALAQTEQERLQNEATLAFSVYNSLAQKLEQDRLRVQEQTPVFAVIEPASLPLKPSSPRKLLILIAFVFLGGILSVGYVLFKNPIKTLYEEINNNK